MTKPKLMIIFAIVALAAAGAGLKVSGALGSGKTGPKMAPAWVSLMDPFVVNLAGGADGDMHYAKLSISVEAGPMDKKDLATFDAKDANAPTGATDPMVGPDAISADPVIRSAVVDAVSSFSVTQILGDKDHAQLKAAILQKIQAAEQGEDARVPKADRTPGASPFNIAGVLITDFAIQ